MPKKRLPTIVDGAVREKVTIKWRAGIRHDSVVKKVWEGLEGNPNDIVSAEKFGRFKAEAKGKIERREKLAVGNTIGETLGEIQGNKRRDRNESVFALPASPVA